MFSIKKFLASPPFWRKSLEKVFLKRRLKKKEKVSVFSHFCFIWTTSKCFILITNNFSSLKKSSFQFDVITKFCNSMIIKFFESMEYFDDVKLFDDFQSMLPQNLLNCSEYHVFDNLRINYLWIDLKTFTGSSSIM